MENQQTQPITQPAPQVPVQPPVESPKPEMSGSGTASNMPLVWVLGILVIFALGATGFLYYQNTQLQKKISEMESPAPVATVTPRPTSTPQATTSASPTSSPKATASASPKASATPSSSPTTY